VQDAQRESVTSEWCIGANLVVDTELVLIVEVESTTCTRDWWTKSGWLAGTSALYPSSGEVVLVVVVLWPKVLFSETGD